MQRELKFMEFSETFLYSTSKDYDYPLEKVRGIANVSKTFEEFYNRMEDTITERLWEQ